MVQTSSVEYFFHIFFFCRVRLSCLRLLVRPGFSALIHAQLCVSVCVCVSCVPVAYCVMRRMRFQSCRGIGFCFFFLYLLFTTTHLHIDGMMEKGYRATQKWNRSGSNGMTNRIDYRLILNYSPLQALHEFMESFLFCCTDGFRSRFIHFNSSDMRICAWMFQLQVPFDNAYEFEEKRLQQCHYDTQCFCSEDRRIWSQIVELLMEFRLCRLALVEWFT